MARCDRPGSTERNLPRTDEQSRICNHIRRVFGREPSSIHNYSHDGAKRGSCVVKLQFGLHATVELFCAEGLLVGIPPKRRWEK